MTDLAGALPPSLEVEEEGLCFGLSGSYSVGLHAGATVIVLVSSLCGVLLPVFAMYIPALKQNPFFFVLGKCAATGVLFSVSLVHLVHDAIKMFEEPCVPANFIDSYPAYAFLFALTAALIMHFLDSLLADLARRWMQRSALQAQAEGKESMEGVVPQGEAVTTDMAALAAADASSASRMAHMRRVVSAVCMEFGVTLHSVFVGLDAGLTTNAALRPLIVALVFHQLFEGMALGARYVDAKFSLTLKLVLGCVFSFSAPAGMMAATIVVALRPDTMSGAAFVTTMAIISSLCGGILLYLAFNLLFIDFDAEARVHCADGVPFRLRKRFGMFVALWLGMLMMALVGKWA